MNSKLIATAKLPWLRLQPTTTGPIVLCGSTLLAFVLLGYHPYAEDGGIYTAAIAARMNPALFSKEHAWVEGHTRFAGFVPAAAWLFYRLHLALNPGLLLLQILGLFTTLSAVWLLARHCFQSRVSAVYACLFFSICAGLPVAGTSLYLIDPYVTARTFSTPLMLFAVLLVLQHRWKTAAGLVLVAGMIHPLMALWGTLLLAFLAVRSRRPLQVFLCGGAIAAAGAAFVGSPPDSALVHTLALGRAYWFLSQWRWYEVLGALAPCVLLWLLAFRLASKNTCLKALAIAAFWTTGTALAIALCFARLYAHTSAVAKYQPLRALQLVFALFLIVGAGALPVILVRRHRVMSLTVLSALLIFGVVSMQRILYPASMHIELPGLASRNPWMQAFQWIRMNTGKGDLFAIDADYTSAAGEDAQGFRAATLRSVLPDRAKDGGIASVAPSLTGDWKRGVEAQTDLNTHLDPNRVRRLRDLGVSWVVVVASTATPLPCPYQNGEVKVCRLQD